ncbi:MAG TPA: DUF3850 domain-containing protein [Chitinophagales bacterium]|nr:DUF3850 domain-containing protein [Chitinophagales bacterium]HMX77145.1 DUF3850 domain-containing protein [Chitinophagaceae bacterium]HNA14762.1 DUF3850 domain-containing protein [Cyclobacteriaceae bacterium]HNC13942.1 DUF3850 domain-containing protein [Cyclobacteriaceae bacterium]HNH32168.1 DUF3850 domain-containing protein [bacterium]
MTHALKTINPFYKAVADREKTFEVRKADRPFSVGDKLLLQEYSEQGGYSGQEEEFRITYILDGGQFGIEKGFCVLGIKEIEKY